MPNSIASGYWHGKERTLRYQPDGEAFVIVNGKIKYNKALYGGNTGFRVETGDVPEFAMYMPGVGGNIHFGLIKGSESLWLNNSQYIQSTYIPGKRMYTIKDDFIENGVIEITALASYEADAMLLEISWKNIPQDVQLSWVYGGATGKNLSRNGDLNADPPNSFDLKTGNCSNNLYKIEQNTFDLTYGGGTARYITGLFPENTTLRTGNPQQQSTPITAFQSEALETHPMLAGKLPLESSGKVYIALSKKEDFEHVKYADLSDKFKQADESRIAIVHRIKINTPDPFINTVGGIAAMTGDAIWDGNVYQHGAVGWRIPLSGWRGAYTADALGWHDRAITHFSAYAKSQVTEPALGPVVMDTSRHLARVAPIMGTQMYSSGYICRNPNGKFQTHHYDMNLCYIDELLWHFNWTGDWNYVREMWPVLERHLDWEKRNFDPDGDGLYDAYACIWASDALQYSSGGVTHSSAYNYRANKLAAEIAEKIGKNPEPYRKEAEKILQAINSQLWMKEKGWWAEYKEFLGYKQLHPSAALWTIYHAIDSDIHDPFQAYQALRYVDKEIPHIPVKGNNLQDDGYEVVSTTSWMPYSWSINNVAFAEILHTTLAYWQGGQKEKAFKLWKSAILDAMYLGSSPGNIVQVCFYDAARGETYRDFADPVGMFARTLVQGLFGVIPDALNQSVTIRPGLPSEWEYASFETPDVKFDYKRSSNKDEYDITLLALRNNNLKLEIPARKDKVKSVLLNGKSVTWQQLPEAIEIPKLSIDCGIAGTYNLQIEWEGKDFYTEKELVVAQYEKLSQQYPSKLLSVFDPQQVFSGLKTTDNDMSGEITGELGHRTVFMQLQQGDFAYWYPVRIEIRKPFAVLNEDGEGKTLQFRVQNNTQELKNYDLKTGGFNLTITVKPHSVSDVVEVPAIYVVPGSNQVIVTDKGNNQTQSFNVINWNLSFGKQPEFTHVDMSKVYNAKISDIFNNKYLSPRSPYGTMQIPWQGIGEWCHPLLTANIDEQGLINVSSQNAGIYNMENGISFKIPADATSRNIIYTSLWDNYPESVAIPLTGKASHAYLTMAGSTNHMQSRFVNGIVEVSYKDGTKTQLELINPENWCPIEQDYFHDGYAFNLQEPRPWRIYLKTGEASRDAEKSLGIEGVYTRQIEGGAATVLDLPLDNTKELDSLVLRTTANEVVIGLIAVSLLK